MFAPMKIPHRLTPLLKQRKYRIRLFNIYCLKLKFTIVIAYFCECWSLYDTFLVVMTPKKFQTRNFICHCLKNQENKKVNCRNTQNVLRHYNGRFALRSIWCSLSPGTGHLYQIDQSRSGARYFILNRPHLYLYYAAKSDFGFQLLLTCACSHNF